MKKIICLLLFFIALQVQAQEFYFTPKAGLNLANSSKTGGSMKPGLNLGIAAEYMVTPTFAAEAGLYYSMQGSKFDYGTVDLQHDYLNIPILAKFYLNRGFNLFVGPQVGFLVSTNKLGYGNDDYNGVVIDKNMSTPIDFSAVIGAGYVFFYGFTVSANVNIGLVNKIKDNFTFKTDGTPADTFTTNGESSKNMVIQLNLGYRF